MGRHAPPSSWRLVCPWPIGGRSTSDVVVTDGSDGRFSQPGPPGSYHRGEELTQQPVVAERWCPPVGMEADGATVDVSPVHSRSTLQMRTHVMNEDLADDFRRRYSAFVAPTPSAETEATA